MDTHVIIQAFLLTLFAGLSTGVGSALAFFTKKTNTKFLSVSLGFSAGVMIYVSMVEIFVKGKAELVSTFGAAPGSWYAIAGFFGGILLIAVIDKLIPSFENPHEVHRIEEMESDIESAKKRKLLKMGVLSAIAIGIHNFPEGLATFTAALTDPGLGIAIAVAIAIHNIPEGIAVSIPLYYATGNKKKAFWYSFLSGIAEPVGAILGFLLLMPFLNAAIFGLLFTCVAGIMVFISLDELLPTAREYGEHHLAIYGLVAGMVVMAVSLNLFI